MSSYKFTASFVLIAFLATAAAQSDPADAPLRDVVVALNQSTPHDSGLRDSIVRSSGQRHAEQHRGAQYDSAVAAESATECDGFTEPYADILLAAAEMGVIADVSVQQGDHVTAGQLIAQVDDSELQVSHKISKAAAAAMGELMTAQTQLELQQADYEKLQLLFQKTHASQQELDKVAGEIRLAKARLQSVQEDLELRRMEVARIQSQIRRRQVRSTIDGIVVEVLKDRGEFVSPSDPVVARIVQLNPLKVEFSVPSRQRSELKVGQKVSVLLGADLENVTGTVKHLSPMIEASSGKFVAKVVLPNPNARWQAGERALLQLNGDSKISLPVANKHDASIPSSVIQ